MKYLITITLVVLTLSSGISQAEPTSFGISPPLFDLTAKPGETMIQKIKIENPLGRTSTYKITLKGAVAKPAGVTEVPMSSLPPDHIARNITIDTPAVSVPSKSFKYVTFTMAVPQSAKGTQYARFEISRGSDDKMDHLRSDEYKREVGLGMQPGIAITLQLTVDGTVSYACKVVGVQAARPSTNRPPEITVKLQNTGNGALSINPLLALVDSAGKAGVRMRSKNSVSISPGAIGEITFTSDGSDIKPGSYKGIMTIGGKYAIAPIQTNISIR